MENTRTVNQWGHTICEQNGILCPVCQFIHLHPTIEKAISTICKYVETTEKQGIKLPDDVKDALRTMDYWYM